MKKTQRKDAFRNIKKRIVSFFSLCLVIMLGLGALLTTRYMGAGLESKLAGYYGERSFKNYEMIASLGVSEKSLEKIRQTDGVIAVEGVIQADATISDKGRKINGTVLSETKEVSVPELVEGNLPKGKSECIIGEDAAEVNNLKVGDKVKISLTGLDALGDEPPLYEKEFTITGLMHHPDYLRRKAVNTFVLPMDAFNKAATDGLYTNAYIRTEEPQKTSMFSEEYFEKMGGTTKSLEELAEELGADRTKEIKDDANSKIDEEWKKALAQMDDAQAQIDDGEAELNARLADGRNELNKAQDTLNKRVAKYRKELKDNKKKLKKAKDTVKKIDKALPGVKKQIAEMREKYNGDLDNTLKDIASAEKILDELEKIEDITSGQFSDLIKTLAKFVVDRQETILKVRDFFRRDDVQKIAEQIKEITKGAIDPTKIVQKIATFDAEGLIDLANMLLNFDPSQIDDARAFIAKMREFVNSIKEALKVLDEIDAYIKTYEENRAKIGKEIAAYDKKIADGEKKLKAEQKKYQSKINAGWSRYYAEKAKYETKLEEAKLLLEENKEEAEKKLAEAREEVEKMEPCRWIALDRRANSGYVDARSNLAAITSAGNVFGILFMVVTAIVCLSTLIIIIDEQKKLVGTSKAFGFHKGEILGKYLTFGTASAVVGSILAAALAYGLSSIVQVKYAESGMYQVGPAKSVFTPGITGLAALAILLVTIVASIVACADILRSPASVLMKGEVLKKDKGKKKKEASKAGSLYSRLIMRNMAEDKARVFVTVAIIAFSCMLIGMGISMKLAYDGMTEKQISDVHKYDLKVSMNGNVTDEQSAKLNSILASEGVRYLPATTKTMLYKWDGRIDGLQLICADSEKLGDFYAITDPKTKETMEIPESGVLIQKRMNESYKMDIGDKLPILDTSLKENEAEIKGYFTNYVGRTVIASPDAYKSIFGKKPENNSFYIILDGVDEEKLKSDLLAVTDEINFTEKDDFKTRFASVANLYNIIVILITGMAILISFMILTNLSNIFLTRRKTELSVMRVNGFSVKQAKGYLSKETIFTTGLGLALGVILGAILTPPVIGLLEQPDLEFVKSFQPIAWIIAVALEALFAILINSVIFNKVKKLNLRDIA